MLQLLFGILLFLIVLFTYLHIRFHLKINNDLDVIDLVNENISKERLDEISTLRSPLKIKAIMPFNQNDILNKYQQYSINLRKNNEHVWLPIKLKDALEFIKNKDGQGYYSERNEEFIKETLLINSFLKDDYYKPVLSLKPKYDIIIGNKLTCTPIQYKNDYKNIIVVCSGKCRVKLFNPNSIKYLNIYKDYDNYEFSDILKNPFNEDIEKSQFIETNIEEGQSLFIPPYWAYSIMFDDFTVIGQYLYNTPMSYLSVMNDLVKYILQQQNIKNKI